MGVTAQALYQALRLSAPVVVAAALIGLVIGALQVLTQVREPGFAFASRLVAISLVLVVAGPWMLATAEQFTLEVWALIAEVAS
jgi:flagellar biosynthetic protein FliQ